MYKIHRHFVIHNRLLHRNHNLECCIRHHMFHLQSTDPEDMFLEVEFEMMYQDLVSIILLE